jgi:hypothetical protein
VHAPTAGATASALNACRWRPLIGWSRPAEARCPARSSGRRTRVCLSVLGCPSKASQSPFSVRPITFRCSRLSFPRVSVGMWGRRSEQGASYSCLHGATRTGREWPPLETQRVPSPSAMTLKAAILTGNGMTIGRIWIPLIRSEPGRTKRETGSPASKPRPAPGNMGGRDGSGQRMTLAPFQRILHRGC